MFTKKENVILEKSYAFAVRTIRLYQYLSKERKEYVLSKQILRCGTSIGADVEEAEGGFSKKDFTAKMGIAYKEARESSYWLRLLKDTEYINDQAFDSLNNDCDEILKILFSIIKSARS